MAAPPPKLARKDMFLPAKVNAALTGKLTIVDKGADAKGKPLVQVTIKDYKDTPDKFMGADTFGYRDEYCTRIMCNTIKADPTHGLVIQRLNEMEMDFDGPVSSTEPAKTVSRGKAVTNKNNLPALYTALYLAYLYRIYKAPSCNATPLPAVEQCASFKAAGQSTYTQLYGGGKRRAAKRGSRKASKKQRRAAGTRRKH